MQFFDLQGERITLTAIEESGLSTMHEYAVNPEFFRYLEYEPHTTLGQTRDYLKRLMDFSSSGTGHYWFIRLKDNSRIIGTFGVVDIHRHRQSAEIGYGLSPEYWGKGYLREALGVVLRHLFIDHDFFRITAKSQDNNTPSIQALKKAGFQKEGLLRKFYRDSSGTRHDAVVFSLLKEEYLRCNLTARGQSLGKQS
jgi:[ribosomal protein S5]-alanine N-acetyltransferase